MQGLLKTRGPGSQFLILVSVALVSVFLVGLLGSIVLASISGMSLTQLSEMSKWDYSNPQTLFVVRGMQFVQFIGLFVIPSFLCARLFSTNTKRYMGLKRPSNFTYLAAGILIMIVSIPLVGLLGELNRHVEFPAGIARWMKESEDSASQVLKGLLLHNTMKDLLLNIVFVAVLAAVGEELLFRGMAQRLLIKWFRSPWAGIIVSAVLFSAFHLQFYGFLPRLLLGIFLGAMYWYSGSLWVAILGHFVYDALQIVMVYYRPEMLNEESVVRTGSIALAGAVSAVLCALVLAWMVKKSQTKYEEVYAGDDIPVKDHPF